jgi:hypothetical protein
MAGYIVTDYGHVPKVQIGNSGNGTANQLAQQLMGKIPDLGAGEARYNQTLAGYDTVSGKQAGDAAGIVGGYQNRQSGAQSMLAGLGQAERADIRGIYQQRMAQADQGLTNRGLGNSTVRSSVQRGMASGEAADVARQNEQLRKEWLALYTSLTGDKLNAESQQNALGYSIAQNKLQYQGSYEGDKAVIDALTKLALGEQQAAVTRDVSAAEAQASMINAQSQGYSQRFASDADLRMRQANQQSITQMRRGGYLGGYR